MKVKGLHGYSHTESTYFVPSHKSVVTFSPNADLLGTDYAFEGGNDGVVILEDGTKYVSSVRFGSVSRILHSQEATLIAEGTPSAASMCYDSIQHQ